MAGLSLRSFTGQPTIPLDDVDLRLNIGDSFRVEKAPYYGMEMKLEFLLIR
jgi:hypothetical protein